MTAKGILTKKRITDAARLLFSEKGYIAVTMKDVCDAASISRGGLYSYFPSTGEILACIIEDEQARAHAALDAALEAGRSADEIVIGFVSSRLHEITSASGSISAAVTEFAKSSEYGRKLAQSRADSSVHILSETLLLGQRTGAYREFDVRSASYGLLWLIEGMSAHHTLFGLTYEEAMAQVHSFMGMMRV